MSKFFILAIMGLLPTLAGHAETNVIYTTNFVTASANFRVVNGQVYNTTNPLWTNIAGRVWRVADNIVVIEKSLMIGLGTNAPQKLAITNLGAMVSEGDQVKTLAMRVGLYKARDITMELYDCGTNAVVPMVKTNEIGPLDHEAIKRERL